MAVKLKRGISLFVAASIVGLMAVFFGSSETAALRDLAERVRPGYLMLCLLAVPLTDWLVAGLRMWLFTSAVCPQVSYHACVRNCAVGGFMGAATPSQTGGSLAQAYVLIREGASGGQALTVLFMTFFSTLVFYLVASVAALWFAGAGVLPGFGGSALFVAAVLLFALFAGLGLLVAAFPERAKAWLEKRGSRWRGKERKESFAGWVMESLEEGGRTLRLITRTQKWRFALSLALTVLIFGNKFFAGWLAARALGLSPPLGEIMAAQFFLNVMIYFFPTPGGSGGAEVGAGIVMAGIIPGGLLASYTLLWRTATMYLSVLAGGAMLLWYLPRTAAAAVAAGQPEHHDHSEAVSKQSETARP